MKVTLARPLEAQTRSSWEGWEPRPRAYRGWGKQTGKEMRGPSQGLLSSWVCPLVQSTRADPTGGDEPLGDGAFTRHRRGPGRARVSQLTRAQRPAVHTAHQARLRLPSCHCLRTLLPGRNDSEPCPWLPASAPASCLPPHWSPTGRLSLTTL